MGAWDVKVFSNDCALDEMYGVVQNPNKREAIIDLLNNDEPWCVDIKLLGVAFVDAAINGVDENIFGSLYEYKDWLYSLKDEQLTDLRNRALEELSYIKKNDKNWVPMARKDRKALLDKLEQRLVA